MKIGTSKKLLIAGITSHQCQRNLSSFARMATCHHGTSLLSRMKLIIFPLVIWRLLVRAVWLAFVVNVGNLKAPLALTNEVNPRKTSGFMNTFMNIQRFTSFTGLQKLHSLDFRRPPILKRNSCMATAVHYLSDSLFSWGNASAVDPHGQIARA